MHYRLAVDSRRVGLQPCIRSHLGAAILGEIHGVQEPNISDWRRKTFGALTAALRFGDPKAEAAVLPDTSGPLILARGEAVQWPKPLPPGADQSAPQQEKGTRKEILR